MDFEAQAYGQLADASAPEWIRGRARLDGDSVVLEPGGEPFTLWQRERELGRSLLGDLLDVRGAYDVLGFARTWGLLWHGPGASEYREPIADWLRAAGELRLVLEIAFRLQASLKSRKPEVTERLRELLHARIQVDEKHWPANLAVLDVERRAAACVMVLLNRGLLATRLGVISTALLTYPMDAGKGETIEARGLPDQFYNVTFFKDLVGYAYGTLARHIVERHKLYECDDCGAVKPRLHGNVKYCSTRCESAAKEERRKARSRVRLTPT